MSKLGKKTIVELTADTCTTVLQEKEMNSISMHLKSKHSAPDDNESYSYSDNTA